MLKEYIFISDGYRGGANTFMNNHMEYLISKKKKVFLYDQNPNFTFEKLNKKISTFRVDFRSNKKKLIKKLEEKILLSKEKKFLLVITNYAHLIMFYSFFKSLDKDKVKIILTLHSGIFNLNLKRYIAGFIFSLIYKNVDYLFFGSSSSKFWWKKMYPWMTLKKSLIHFNGVKLPKKINLKKIGKNVQISYAGRIEKENDPEFFLEIAIEYLKRDKKAIFNIFGDGPLIKILKKNYNSKNIIFHGWVKKEKIYKISDIIVITSPINNFPYVALEAKSYGIPVVSCSKGDIKKIVINNVDGYLDYTNSVKKIIYLIKKVKKNYNKFSKNSLARSKNFELINSCKKFWNSIDD